MGCAKNMENETAKEVSKPDKYMNKLGC